MIVITAQLFKVAYGKYALGAYNINNLEQTLGPFKGNVQSKAPFTIQLSRAARKYTDKRYLESMIHTPEQVAESIRACGDAGVTRKAGMRGVKRGWSAWQSPNRCSRNRSARRRGRGAQQKSRVGGQDPIRVYNFYRLWETVRASIRCPAA